ncbi:MAG: SMC-Scp complex subunit ScpB [Rhodopirellula sp.]|nr:SMC-Scp complex subunit ScpB [Rhodopirellula sp.]
MPISPEPPDEEGISLQELSEAFAQAMESRPRENAETDGVVEVREETAEDGAVAPRRADRRDEAAEAEPWPDAGDSFGDDNCPISPRSIFEAMLFVGDGNNEPLTAARAAELMRGVEPEEIPGLVEELNRTYIAGGCPYRIAGEGAGYRLTLAQAFHPVRDKFYGRVREARLSQAAVDVLAIVAYRQPLTAEDIARLRAAPSAHILAQLVRRRLLRIERAEGKPRITRYYTTDRFLELFGLESLEDLPQSEELDRK